MQAARASRLFALSFSAIVSSTAGAQSESQSFYASCLAEARDEYAQCRHYGHARNCSWEYHKEKDRCWNTFTAMDRSTPSYGGYPGRFEPVPIPQRPVYVLPGMK